MKYYAYVHVELKNNVQRFRMRVFYNIFWCLEFSEKKITYNFEKNKLKLGKSSRNF